MKKIAVFTSGGDAPGMNACVRAVVRTALAQKLEVTGIVQGYEGMIEGDFIPMTGRTVSNIIQLGGTILQSARSDRFRTPEGRRLAYEQLKKEGIEGIVVIGGDGSFTGARVFLEEYPDLQMVGVPGTIDNDLFGTDYTIGYDTAINTAMNAIDNIKDTACAHNRLFIVEVMGRDAGYIALHSGIATGAEAILIPEIDGDEEEMMQLLSGNFDRKKHANIIVVAEGDESGGAMNISEKIKARFPGKFDIRVTILGHIQRGGRPTCMKRVRAGKLGMVAVLALLEGKNGVMVGQVNDRITYTPFAQACKQHQPIDPLLWQMVEYLS